MVVRRRARGNKPANDAMCAYDLLLADFILFSWESGYTRAFAGNAVSASIKVFPEIRGKVPEAWYLLNAKEVFKDNEAECTQKWVDGATGFMTIQTAMNWVTYFIGCGICSHIVYTAYCARAPRGCHESGTRH